MSGFRHQINICYILIYAYTSTYMQNHNDTMITTSEDFFKKIYTSHFIARVRKGFLKVCVWEGAGDRTKLQYIDPYSYGRQRCVFLVLQGCSTRGSGAQLSAECWLSLVHLVTNFSGPQLIRGPKGPFGLMWLSLPHLVYISNCSLTVLTELYNSSTSTQSPIQSLEWHVWSSSSGNNCHAVQRSLSSGASVYECIMGFFPCPILLARSTYAIFPHKCHRNVSLPSGTSLWNGKFGRVEGQNTTWSQGWPEGFF